MIRCCLILLSVLLGGAVASQSHAQERQAKLALVIANSDYNLDGNNTTPINASAVLGFVSDLRNPRNDGTAMRAALDRLGFEVTYVENANRVRMAEVLGRFAGRVDRASGDPIVFIYYSGHAMQVNGVNFLIPAGAQLPSDQDLSRASTREQELIIRGHTIALQDIFDALRDPGEGGLNLIILDSCRDNPWEARLYGRNRSAATRGLADQPTRLSGTLVAYSTAPGEPAADGDEAAGSNSPYTEALLRWIERPGLNVRDILNRVGRDLRAATGQISWTNSAYVPDICLAGCRDQAAAAPSPAPPRAPPVTAPAAAPAWETAASVLARAALGQVTAREWSASPAAALIPSLLQRAPLPAFQSLAQAGDARAQWVIGQAYLDGLGIGRSAEEARIWLQRAADQGDARAQVSLGYLHDRAEDLESMVTWYRRAAERGNAIAQYNLGALYDGGRGVAQDHVQAMIWYRRAADQGLAVAEDGIGTLYKFGRGVARNPDQAAGWYRRAADQGLAVAQTNLAYLYSVGVGVARNDALAVDWYRRAADQGFGMAQYNLGIMYRDGRGVARDHARAMALFRQAAAQGHTDGQVSVGFMYSRGLGVAQDYVQAASWYRQAADQGNSGAQYNLGIFLYDGRPGVPQDQQAGLSLVRRAAAQGLELARTWLAQRGLPPS